MHTIHTLTRFGFVCFTMQRNEVWITYTIRSAFLFHMYIWSVGQFVVQERKVFLSLFKMNYTQKMPFTAERCPMLINIHTTTLSWLSLLATTLMMTI